MVNIAYEYLSEELSVLPLKENKAPLLPTGHPYLYKLMDENKVESLFKDAKKIGIACGKVSNGFECIDFDAHKGEDIQTIFDSFIKNDGVYTIINTHGLPLIKTPSGGFHIYYKTDEIESGKHLALWEDKTVMIETRGNGQYVATVPSAGYLQFDGVEIIRTPKISIEERDYLFSICESLSKFKVEIKDEKGSGKWPEKFDISTPWGRFNEQGNDETKDLLLNEGWQFIRLRYDNVELWRRPNKDDGISATYGAQHNMFYNFSGSAIPFSERVGYTHFDILLLLKFKGDLKNAYDYLFKKYDMKNGYQSAPPPKSNEIPKDVFTNDAVYNDLNIELDDFPLSIFPPDIQTVLINANRTMNHPVDITGSALINVFGGILGNKLKLNMMAGWEAPAIFWTAIVGKSGAAKSHPLSFIIKSVDRIDAESYKNYKNDYIKYENELQEYENAPNNNKPKRPSKPIASQIIVRDVTMEALHKTLDYNSNGLIMYRDELKGWLGSMNSYRKGSDEETWLEIFNNNAATIGRVSKEDVRIENSFVNVIGTIQDSVLSDIINKENGLVERFLYTKTYSEIKGLSREKMRQSDIDFLYDSIKSIHEIIKQSENTVIDIPDNMFDFIIEEDNKIIKIQKSGNETDKFVGYLSKMRTYLPRFILVIAFIEDAYLNIDLEIKEHHIRKAGQLVSYYIKSARKLFIELNEIGDLKSVVNSMSNKTNREKCIELKNKGFNNTQISETLGISKGRVSQILSK